MSDLATPVMTATIHPSDFALDRGGAATSSHVRACEACAARVEAARQGDAEWVERVLPRSWPVVRARLERRRRFRFALFLGAPALAAAGFALVLRATPWPHGQEQSTALAPAADEPYRGVKGHMALYPGEMQIFVRRGGEVFPLDPGARLRARDGVRLVYRGARARHLEIRVVGADRTEHLFHPASPGSRGATAPPTPTGIPRQAPPGTPEAGLVPLVRPGDAIPGAAVADDGPGPEVIVVRASDTPFPAGSATTPPGVEEHRIVLDKEPP